MSPSRCAASRPFASCLPLGPKCKWRSKRSGRPCPACPSRPVSSAASIVCRSSLAVRSGSSAAQRAETTATPSAPEWINSRAGELPAGKPRVGGRNVAAPGRAVADRGRRRSGGTHAGRPRKSERPCARTPAQRDECDVRRYEPPRSRAGANLRPLKSGPCGRRTATEIARRREPSQTTASMPLAGAVRRRYTPRKSSSY